MDLGIEGKKALVCASSQGMGKAIAMSLATEGAEVFMCARGKDELETAANEIKKVSRKPVHHQQCDLMDKASRESLVRTVNATFGNGVDILVHNIGGPRYATVEQVQFDEWQRAFEQLFSTVVSLNDAFIPAMKERRWGRVINITSLSVYEPIPTLAMSNAMRTGVTAMLKTLSNEVAPFNVTINCVAPGLILTDRTEDSIKNKMSAGGGTREDHLKDYASSVPMGRLGTPEEFAAVVAFLCSEKASYVTGSTICVDGGKRKSTL
jgi:3-oxoacyl-[acyl-carrier protein] reductase